MSLNIGQKKIATMEQRMTEGWKTQKERKCKRHIDIEPRLHTYM